MMHHAPLVLPLATVHSRRLLPLSGTVCRSQFGDRQHCQFSVIDWKLSFLLGLSVRDVSTPLTLLRDTSYYYVSLQFRGLYDTIVIRPSSSSSSSLNACYIVQFCTLISCLSDCLSVCPSVGMVHCICVVIFTPWVVSCHTCILDRRLDTWSWNWLTGKTSECKFISTSLPV